MARDGLTPQTPDRADASLADERAAPTFGPLQGGLLNRWMVQERRG